MLRVINSERYKYCVLVINMCLLLLLLLFSGWPLPPMAHLKYIRRIPQSLWLTPLTSQLEPEQYISRPILADHRCISIGITVSNVGPTCLSKLDCGQALIPNPMQSSISILFTINENKPKMCYRDALKPSKQDPWLDLWTSLQILLHQL